jgi:hypothetical protein
MVDLMRLGDVAPPPPKPFGHELLSTLSEEFQPEVVGKIKIIRRGEAKEFDFIPAPHIIKRLNDTVGLGWEFIVVDKIVDHEIGQVAVLGELRIQTEPGFITRQQWGGARLTTSGGYYDSFGDTMKAAATDALKKCAQLYGVGMYLHDKNPGMDEDESKKQDESIAQQKAMERAEASQPPDGVSDRRASKSQTAALDKMTAGDGIDRKQMLEILGVAGFEELSYADAASIIIMKHPVWKKLGIR